MKAGLSYFTQFNKSCSVMQDDGRFEQLPRQST